MKLNKVEPVSAPSASTSASSAHVAINPAKEIFGSVDYVCIVFFPTFFHAQFYFLKVDIVAGKINVGTSRGSCRSV